MWCSLAHWPVDAKACVSACSEIAFNKVEFAQFAALQGVGLAFTLED